MLEGSAATGREFAALQFTNTGSASCELVGYPSVALQRGGALIGTASQPALTSRSSMRLPPGGTAESQLNDYTTCSAPLSDAIRVTAPGSSISTIRPAQLRACTLRVGMLGQPQ